MQDQLAHYVRRIGDGRDFQHFLTIEEQKLNFALPLIRSRSARLLPIRCYKHATFRHHTNSDSLVKLFLSMPNSLLNQSVNIFSISFLLNVFEFRLDCK